MKQKISLLLILSTLLFAADGVDEKLKNNHDFLEVSKNFLRVYNVHNMSDSSERTLDRLNNVNFAMKPRVVPIKPFDTLKILYAYPIKIFLPVGSVVTNATLSNSKETPKIAHNIVIVSVDKDFQSGLLDIVYLDGVDKVNGKYLSIKLDKYSTLTEESVQDNKLYTQVQYYNATELSNNEILSYLSSAKYGDRLSQITFSGKTYSIHLVNIVSEGKVLEEYMDKKYINCALMHNDKTYNYYIE